MSRFAREPGFVHLHVHSAYSLLEGALPIARLVDLAIADGQPALGLADSGNLFGALEFSEKFAKAGLQPIVGCQLAVRFGDEAEERRGVGRIPGIVLMAASEVGYRNLMDLASRAFLGSDPGESPHVTPAMIDAAADGLIALTGGAEGPIDRAFRDGMAEIAGRRLAGLADIFGDRLYVEVQR
ncbi:MAG: PHP domain-containing protein, partial [Hyphomicrobiales bacterium]|nr:PHP domain-containing protein [Hyphomicrobiales bacterium]